MKCDKCGYIILGWGYEESHHIVKEGKTPDKVIILCNDCYEEIGDNSK